MYCLYWLYCLYCLYCLPPFSPRLPLPCHADASQTDCLAALGGIAADLLCNPSLLPHAVALRRAPSLRSGLVRLLSVLVQSTAVTLALPPERRPAGTEWEDARCAALVLGSPELTSALEEHVSAAGSRRLLSSTAQLLRHAPPEPRLVLPLLRLHGRLCQAALPIGVSSLAFSGAFGSTPQDARLAGQLLQALQRQLPPLLPALANGLQAAAEAARQRHATHAAALTAGAQHQAALKRVARACWAWNASAQLVGKMAVRLWLCGATADTAAFAADLAAWCHACSEALAAGLPQLDRLSRLGHDAAAATAQPLGPSVAAVGLAHGLLCLAADVAHITTACNLQPLVSTAAGASTAASLWRCHSALCRAARHSSQGLLALPELRGALLDGVSRTVQAASRLREAEHKQGASGGSAAAADRCAGVALRAWGCAAQTTGCACRVLLLLLPLPTAPARCAARAGLPGWCTVA